MREKHLIREDQGTVGMRWKIGTVLVGCVQNGNRKETHCERRAQIPLEQQKNERCGLIYGEIIDGHF